MNFQSFGLLTEVKTLITLASKGPQWRVVTFRFMRAGFRPSCRANVRLSFGPFGLKLWILWVKPTQQKLEITFLAVKMCYEQWWVILSCNTFLLVWQPSASRLICINFPIQLLSRLLWCQNGIWFPELKLSSKLVQKPRFHFILILWSSGIYQRPFLMVKVGLRFLACLTSQIWPL